MADILIQNGSVWDGNQFTHADILIADGIIQKIAPHISDSAEFIYDATGKIVSAGLVDAHMHLHGVSSEIYGYHPEMGTFPFGVVAAAEACAVYADKKYLDSLMLKNVVYVSSNVRDNHVYFEESEDALKRYKEKAVGIKLFYDTTGVNVTDIKPVHQVCSFAQKNGLRVMVHCNHSPVKMSELLAALRPGDTLTHAFHGGENNASEDQYESMRIAQRRGVIIDVGFAGHVHTDFQVLRDAIRNGIVPDLISTDLTKKSAYTRGGRYGMTICMSIARYLGMQEADIFRAVTSNPAKVLGKAGEWGELKVGRCADIAVFEFTDASFDLTDHAGNRVQSEKGYRCKLTVVNGQVIYRD